VKTSSSADIWVAVSQAVKDYYVYEGLAADKIVVVPNGVDLEKFSPNHREYIHAPNSDINVVVYGRLIGWKGFSWFIDVFGEAKKDLMGKTLKCIIIGDGPDKNSLISKTRLLGLENDIEFKGHKSEPESILKNADIAMVPSLNPDPFPRVCIEAMASGLPVIATKIGGIPEAVEDGKTGFLVSPGDSETTVKKLLCLANNSELRESMGRAARLRAERYFSKERYVEAIDKLYSRCMEIR
jgi:glycosyltransferase involved in cell wall biosynthesis